MSDLITMTAVERHFGTVARALNGVDLRIEAGESVAITGPSGSGKSTLLQIIGLLDRPSRGRYELAGVEVGRMRDRERTAWRGQRIGFVFQAFHLIPHLNVVENVLLALRYSASVPRAERRSRAHECLEAVGMGHRLLAYPRTLSGGEQQRAAIARAVSGRPAILLCDEPTGNLDSSNASAVMDLLWSMRGADRAVVVVTHDAGVAAQAARRVSMVDGRIVGES